MRPYGLTRYEHGARVDGRARLTKAVREGLRLMMAYTSAGGPEDIGIDMGSSDGKREWRSVERAMRWIQDLP